MLQRGKRSVARWATRRGRMFWVRLSVPVALLVTITVGRVFLTTDLVFVVLLIVFVTYGSGLEFLKRFSPFVALLVSYDALRGLVPHVSKHVHYTEMVTFDRWLGLGELPTAWLQRSLHAGTLHWYDAVFFGIYLMHFVTPVLAGVLVWRLREPGYWRYMWSFVVVSYAAFLTFLVFPAAPPWMAARDHVIPAIQPVSDQLWTSLSMHSVPNLYARFAPNQVAAVPSLHSAYPLLVALFIGRLFGRRWGAVAMLYPASVWFGVVYLGEHYVFDVIAGALYAIGAFLLVNRVMDARDARLARRSPPTGAAGPTPSGDHGIPIDQGTVAGPLVLTDRAAGAERAPSGSPAATSSV